MKNNKKILFVLIPAMLLIWGAIGYQIFSAMDEPESFTIQVQKSSMMDVSTRDTVSYSLILDYDDPFKVSRSRNTVKRDVLNTVNRKGVTTIEKKQTVLWPEIQYGGMVKSSNKKKVGLLTVSGKSYLVNPGDKIGELNILNYTENNILLEYSKQRKTVEK